MKINEEIKTYGLSHGVPITKDDTLVFLCDIINKYNCQNVLEIGTAIGYGSITMAKNTMLKHIDTLEIDEDRYKIAIDNIKSQGLESKITPHLIDAMDYLKACTKKFDLVYLDGPKGQYINYLPLIIELLSPHGIIVADNLYFHGMVTGEIPVSRGCRAMIKGLHKYIDAITTDPRLDTKILQIGDGVGFSILK